MATIHYYLNLKERSTGLLRTIGIGAVQPIDDDYTNGAYVNAGTATDLYNFFREKNGETFFIEGAEGAKIDVIIHENTKFYFDNELTENAPFVHIYVYINYNKDGNRDLFVAKRIEFYLLPSDCYTSEIPNLSSNPFGAIFGWNRTGDGNIWDNLSFIPCHVDIMDVSVTTPCYHITTIRPEMLEWNSHDKMISTVPFHRITYMGVNGPFGTNGYNPNELPDKSTWMFIFKQYNTLTELDDKDHDYQLPSWEYPNGPHGPSKPGGGDGDQDDPSDPIPEDDIIEGLSSDFVKLYKITKANLTALSEYMLQDDFLTNIKKLYADPMDAIISLNTFPINATGTAGVITTSGVSTGINAVQINSSIIDIDCGTIAMWEYWGSFLDYETKISIFLPYVGIQPISTDDFMNDIIHVVYRVDLLSGGFVVFVKNSKGIVHQTTGNMAYHMPVTSIDYSRMYSALITGAVGIAGNAAAGNADGVISGTMSTIQNFHPSIQMSGNFGGNTGICSNKKPYLIIERPVPNVPANYSAIKGNTSNVTVTLGNCSGFTQISDMQIKYISATDAEKTQILSLLRSGVYF